MGGGADPAGGQHFQAAVLRQRRRGGVVRFLQRAIARYIGIEQPDDAQLRHPAGQFGGGNCRRFRPAANGDHTVPRVQGDDHLLAAEPPAQLVNQLRVGDGGGADDDAGGAGVKQSGGGVHAANAAAHLDGNGQGAGDGGNRRQVGRIAAMRPVQVHDMQPLPALGLPTLGNGPRVVGKDGFPGVVALVQADAVAAAQVNGGDDFHQGCSPVKSGRKRADGYGTVVGYCGSKEIVLSKPMPISGVPSASRTRTLTLLPCQSIDP